MSNDKLKKAKIIVVILFLIGFIGNFLTIKYPDMFMNWFKVGNAGAFESFTIDHNDVRTFSRNLTIIGYLFMGTSLIYSAVIFYKWLSE